MWQQHPRCGSCSRRDDDCAEEPGPSIRIGSLLGSTLHRALSLMLPLNINSLQWCMPGCKRWLGINVDWETPICYSNHQCRGRMPPPLLHTIQCQSILKQVYQKAIFKWALFLRAKSRNRHNITTVHLTFPAPRVLARSLPQRSIAWISLF